MELGQICFGNYMGDYETPEYANALIEYLLSEVERVYRNKFQDEWVREEDPGLAGVEYKSYCWSDEEEETVKPNLKLQGSSQEIRWYKYPGRGQTCTIEMDEKQWCKWFNEALKLIRNNDIIL